MRVFEQNFQANLVSSDAIAEKYIDKQVQVYARLGDKSVRVTGKLLGFRRGWILETQYGI